MKPFSRLRRGCVGWAIPIVNTTGGVHRIQASRAVAIILRSRWSRFQWLSMDHPGRGFRRQNWAFLFPYLLI